MATADTSTKLVEGFENVTRKIAVYASESIEEERPELLECLAAIDHPGDEVRKVVQRVGDGRGALRFASPSGGSDFDQPAVEHFEARSLFGFRQHRASVHRPANVVRSGCIMSSMSEGERLTPRAVVAEVFAILGEHDAHGRITRGVGALNADEIALIDNTLTAIGVRADLVSIEFSAKYESRTVPGRPMKVGDTHLDTAGRPVLVVRNARVRIESITYSDKPLGPLATLTKRNPRAVEAPARARTGAGSRHGLRTSINIALDRIQRHADEHSGRSHLARKALAHVLVLYGLDALPVFSRASGDTPTGRARVRHLTTKLRDLSAARPEDRYEYRRLKRR